MPRAQFAQTPLKNVSNRSSLLSTLVEVGMDLSPYIGIGQFGPAYEIMLRNDCHAPGSVDRSLLHGMVRLCDATAGYLYAEHTPTRIQYRPGSRPALEEYVRAAVKDAAPNEDRIAGIAWFCSDLGQRTVHDLDGMRVGGTEEELISRGSDWCADVARVACVLYQVAGYPCRVVFLADTERAYSGHAIVELHRSGTWGAVDPSTSVIYCLPDGRPARTWDLMSDPGLVEAHGPAAYTNPGQFRRAAIANYFAWQSGAYDYAVSAPNEYYRPILEMSDKGWPGGLRWLHGEDQAGRR